MELIFKIILILVYTAFSIIRIRFQLRAQKAGHRTVIHESKRYSIFLSILICYEVFTLFIYLISPQTLGWANVALPLWSRWLGFALAIVSLALFIWVHRHLRDNFSIRLQIMQGQTLTLSGPYQWVRHPMYTAFYVLHIAAFLLTANWFIGLTWLAGLTIIIILRIDREETMMLEKFGEEYRNYMQHTGKFTPQIKFIRFLRSERKTKVTD